jgi:CrcB protein
MAQPSPEGTPDDVHELPIDPDVDAAEDARHHPDTAAPSPFPRARRSRWPRVDWTLVAGVAAGGFAGGLVRYEVGLAWPATSAAFPWSTWSVNTGGAFILGLLLVLVLEVLPPTKYVRAVLATGFCGALTTFSSVATAVDQMLAHARVGLAVGYVAASVAAGLAAASFGMIVGRSIAAYREKGRE